MLLAPMWRGLAHPHDVVQRLHYLLAGRQAILAMDLVKVDIIHRETFERRINCRQYVLAGQAYAVLGRCRLYEHLCSHDHFVAAEQIPQYATRRDFAGAVRIRVGRVEEGIPPSTAARTLG